MSLHSAVARLEGQVRQAAAAVAPPPVPEPDLVWLQAWFADDPEGCQRALDAYTAAAVDRPSTEAALLVVWAAYDRWQRRRTFPCPLAGHFARHERRPPDESRRTEPGCVCPRSGRVYRLEAGEWDFGTGDEFVVRTEAVDVTAAETGAPIAAEHVEVIAPAVSTTPAVPGARPQAMRCAGCGEQAPAVDEAGYCSPRCAANAARVARLTGDW